jgi:prevent-host-death family protein
MQTRHERVEIPATELRENGSEILNRVAYGDEEIVLTRRGKPLAAIVSLAALEALRQLEDAEDIAAAAAAREDVRKHGAIPWEDVKGELHIVQRAQRVKATGTVTSRRRGQ